MKNEDSTFIFELYRTRMQHFTNQGTRLWVRFHYFLTAELALIGIFLLKAEHVTLMHGNLIPFLGILCSILWYLIGAQDLYFYEVYRKGLHSIEDNLVLPKISQDVTSLKDHMAEIKQHPLRFKIKHIGVTSFVAICPILFFVLWIVSIFLI